MFRTLWDMDSDFGVLDFQIPSRGKSKSQKGLTLTPVLCWLGGGYPCGGKHIIIISHFIIKGRGSDDDGAFYILSIRFCCCIILYIYSHISRSLSLSATQPHTQLTRTTKAERRA